MLVVREDDGPGEIRQKADLMEDMAAQTQVKADAVGRRIKTVGGRAQIAGADVHIERGIGLF